MTRDSLLAVAEGRQSTLSAAAPTGRITGNRLPSGRPGDPTGLARAVSADAAAARAATPCPRTARGLT